MGAQRRTEFRSRQPGNAGQPLAQNALDFNGIHRTHRMAYGDIETTFASFASHNMPGEFLNPVTLAEKESTQPDLAVGRGANNRDDMEEPGNGL